MSWGGHWEALSLLRPPPFILNSEECSMDLQYLWIHFPDSLATAAPRNPGAGARRRRLRKELQVIAASAFLRGRAAKAAFRKPRSCLHSACCVSQEHFLNCF